MCGFLEVVLALFMWLIGWSVLRLGLIIIVHILSYVYRFTISLFRFGLLV